MKQNLNKAYQKPTASVMLMDQEDVITASYTADGDYVVTPNWSGVTITGGFEN